MCVAGKIPHVLSVVKVVGNVAGTAFDCLSAYELAELPIDALVSVYCRVVLAGGIYVAAPSVRVMDVM